MKRTLLTGATGFVGAVLARQLLVDGHEVHLLVRPGYAPWRIESIREHVHLHEIDLGDKLALADLIAQIRPDWIFHLAAHGAYSSQTDLTQMIQTNIVATANLLEACLAVGFEAFVNTGSSSEYGFKDHPPTESEWVDPNSYYSVTKVSSTLLCRFMAQKHNAHIVTLRLYSVYGPYEEPTRLMPTLIVRGLERSLPPLVNPNIARDYIYAADVNNACILAATTPGVERGAIYNLGIGLQTTLRDVVDVVRRVLDIPVEPVWGSMPDRQWDTTVWVADNRKIVQDLGWQPTYSFEQGFRQMVNWFHENPAMVEFYRERLGKRP
jgi:UDP-glucose 4-epimerase